MAVIATHSTRAPGVQSFATTVHKAVIGIKHIRLGNLRSSRISSRARPPRVVIRRKSLLVYYYAEGSMQVLMIIPVRGQPLEVLGQRLEDHLANLP